MKIWNIIKEDFEKNPTLDEGWKENLLATVVSMASIFGNTKAQEKPLNTNINVSQQKNNDSMRLDVSKLFTSGRYQLDANDDEAMKTALRQFGAEILKNPTKDFILQVVSSESQVTNYDMEKTSPTYGQRLPVGDLAKKRAETITFIFNAFIKQLKNEGALKGDAKFENPTILRGDIPWPSVNPRTNQKRTNDDPVYTKDQYVYVNVKVVNGKSTADYKQGASIEGQFAHKGEAIYYDNKLYGMVFYPSRDGKKVEDPGILPSGYQNLLLKTVRGDVPLYGKIDEKNVYLKTYLIPWQWYNSNAVHDKLTPEQVNYITTHFEVKP